MSLVVFEQLRGKGDLLVFVREGEEQLNLSEWMDVVEFGECNLNLIFKIMIIALL